MTTYLVTGASGFIGRRLLSALLDRDEAEEVSLLVRADSEPRMLRLIQTMPAPERVRLLIGDLRQDRLGIDDAQRVGLRGRVDHLVHLAATYDLAASTGRNVATNVEGTRRVVELANELQVGTLHHMSSVAVAGDYRGCFSEEMFTVDQPFANSYHRTKYEAEKLVRSASEVPWRVYRPGAVVGDSRTGEMDKIDGPYYMFRLIDRLSWLPAIPIAAPLLGYTNIVPVDYVVNATDYLIHRPGLDFQSFHLTSPQVQSTTDVYNAFASCAGAPMIAIDGRLPAGPAIENVMRQIATVPGAAVLADLFLRPIGIPSELLNVLTMRPTFDSAATQELLRPAGITVPDLNDYANVLWRYWRTNLRHAQTARSSVVPVWEGGASPVSETLRPIMSSAASRRNARAPLSGMRVVITGASSGIGRASAVAAACQGATVLLLARREAELSAVRDEIAAAGYPTAFVYPCDLTDESAVTDTVKAMFTDHDGVEMLVNNAGRSIRRAIADSTDRFHDYDRAMAINYFGAVRLMLHLLPHMRRRRFGHIVNVSSMGVLGATPRYSAYLASKAALDQFTRVAAAETRRDDVTFTTVLMPLVRTPMIAPTKVYNAVPALSADQAADLVVNALLKRPRRLNTPAGRFLGTAQALFPAAVEFVASEIYRRTPN